MKRVGVRELRQNASAVLRRVEAGETIEVTDRGRPVARLVPLLPDGRLAQLVREGRVRMGLGRLSEAPPPLPALPGVPLPSEELAAMRKDER